MLLKSFCLTPWKTLWERDWPTWCGLWGLLGAASSLLQALHVFPDHTHMPDVTPTTRDMNNLSKATSKPASLYTGPGAQFCADLQSSAASNVRVLHFGLTDDSCNAQNNSPIAGTAYNTANIPSRVISLSNFVALRPADLTARLTRTRAAPAKLANTQPNSSKAPWGITSNQRADSSETWQSPVNSSADMFFDNELPARRRSTWNR